MSDQRTGRSAAGPPRMPFGGRGRPGGMMGGGAPAEKPKDFTGTLKRLLVYFGPYRNALIVILVCAVLGTAFNIVGPKIMGQVTTKIFEGIMGKFAAAHLGEPAPSIDFRFIGKVIVALIGLYLVSALFTYIQQYQMAGISQKIVFALRSDINEKLSRLPLKFYDSRTHGEIMSRVTNDIDTIGTTLQQSLTQLLTSVCTILGVLIMMLTISPILTLITLITLPISFLATANIARLSQRNFAAQQKELGILNGHVEEMFTGHTIVKVFGHERKAIEEFDEINDRLYHAGWKAQFVSGIIMPLMNFVNNLGYVLICVVGGIMVANKALKLGDIQAFIQYSRQFTMPIAQTANIANVLQSTIACAERVFEILDEVEEIPERENALVVESPRGEVNFQDVTFGYREGVTLMKDLNIHVFQGQTIAIVGPTGAGKTTLVNLLMRFYEIDGGRITVDGIDIRNLQRGRLRTMFGMVLQDTWLFNGTIEENIAYGRGEATLEQIIQAARTAHADHFIRALPDGYDTILNEEASNISQGEKQLLTIARAILINPAILILDEATSSVDTRTEVYIQNAMKELRKGRTSFVIAHRLSTIRDAELILVMNNGSVIETGNHAELLARRGFYAELYNSQFAGAFVDEQVVSQGV